MERHEASQSRSPVAIFSMSLSFSLSVMDLIGSEGHVLDGGVMAMEAAAALLAGLEEGELAFPEGFPALAGSPVVVEGVVFGVERDAAAGALTPTAVVWVGCIVAHPPAGEAVDGAVGDESVQAGVGFHGIK